MMDCMMGGDCMMGMWGMLLMWLFWILIIALIVWGVYRFATSGRSGPHREGTPPPGETPLETLDRLYAEDRISTEEYEERRRRLGE